MQVPLRDSISRACWGCSAPSEAVPPPRGHPAPWGREQAGIEPRGRTPCLSPPQLAQPASSWEGIPGFPRSFGPWLISPSLLKGFGVTVLPRNTTVWVFVYCWDLSSFSFQPANVVLPLLGRLKSPLLLS